MVTDQGPPARCPVHGYVPGRSVEMHIDDDHAVLVLPATLAV
ncbi:hypothetical protein ACIQM4_25165 [Streptomyces sp. NPDC091272]